MLTQSGGHQVCRTPTLQMSGKASPWQPWGTWDILGTQKKERNSLASIGIEGESRWWILGLASWTQEAFNSLIDVSFENFWQSKPKKACAVNHHFCCSYIYNQVQSHRPDLFCKQNQEAGDCRKKKCAFEGKMIENPFGLPTFLVSSRVASDSKRMFSIFLSPSSLGAPEH